MHISSVRIYVEPVFCLVLAAAILLLPFQWVVAWIVAAILHELGHFSAVRICGHHVFAVQISSCGAKMYTDNLLNSEWLCAISGPAVGFALLLCVKWLPRVAVCGAVQSVYNLLPIEGMDGGRALRSLLGRVFSDLITDKVMKCVSVATAAILLTGSLIFFLQCRTDILPVAICIGLIVSKVKRKFPCKDGLLKVQ